MHFSSRGQARPLEVIFKFLLALNASLHLHTARFFRCAAEPSRTREPLVSRSARNPSNR